MDMDEYGYGNGYGDDISVYIDMVEYTAHGDLTVWLVVWNMNFMTVHSVGNVIIPTDELHHIFQRGWLKPPKSDCY